MHKTILQLIFLLTISYPANASQPQLSQYIENPDIVGKARYTYLVFDVYDATLYAPYGKWKGSEPYALSLTYLRNLSGKKIAERSVQEIRNQGFSDEVTLASWHSRMKRIFPDVTNGTTLTGIYQENKITDFYKDDQYIGSVQDPAFGPWFFGIWLSDKTSEPDFRARLIGNMK